MFLKWLSNLFSRFGRDNTSAAVIQNAIIRDADPNLKKAAAASKGDIKKHADHESIEKSIQILVQMASSGLQMGQIQAVLQEAYRNLIANKAAFTKAYGSDTEANAIVRALYESVVMCLQCTISMVLAYVVDFEAQPNGTYRAVIKADGVRRVKESTLFNSLITFNELSQQHSFKTMLAESAEYEDTVMHELGVFAGAMIAATGLAAVVLLARDMAEKFYQLRGTYSRWLEVQANFIELNAMQLDPKSKPRERQLQTVERFRAVASRIRVDDAETEIATKKNIDENNRTIESALSRPATQTQFGEPTASFNGTGGGVASLL